MDIRTLVQYIWTDWEVLEKIGEGSFGSVYKARRRDIVGESFAAIKVTTIPRNDEELESLRLEGMSPKQSETYLESVVQELVAEIRMMESVKGYTNIVAIEDYKVVKHKTETKWNIFIRMELLTPLKRHISIEEMTENEVIRMGVDLCSALTICYRKNIVHRDIKPENIFVNDQGNYKLGDFGVARKLECLTTNITRKGTFNYMAPEVYNQNLREADIHLAAKVDIYSLGIVMYYLMNNRRLPFIPDKQIPTPNDRQIAIERRMNGESFCPPSHASHKLADVIMKACAFNPSERFDSAEEMRKTLLSVTDESKDSSEDTSDISLAQSPIRQGSKDARFRLRAMYSIICIIALLGVVCWYTIPKLLHGNEKQFFKIVVDAEEHNSYGPDEDRSFSTGIDSIPESMMEVLFTCPVCGYVYKDGEQPHVCTNCHVEFVGRCPTCKGLLVMTGEVLPRFCTYCGVPLNDYWTENDPEG